MSFSAVIFTRAYMVPFLFIQNAFLKMTEVKYYKAKQQIHMFLEVFPTLSAGKYYKILNYTSPFTYKLYYTFAKISCVTTE